MNPKGLAFYRNRIHDLDGEFTLTENETNTEAETDTMATVPNSICVSLQYEHLHNHIQAIYYRSVSVSVKGTLRPLTSDFDIEWSAISAHRVFCSNSERSCVVCCSILNLW